MQRFSLAHAGPRRALFRVQPQSLVFPNETASPLMHARQQMAKALAVPRKRSNVDQRSISPWLLSTHWHEHVYGYNVKELCDLVSSPNKKEFPGLQDIVHGYFSEATQDIHTLQELTLQILNTNDPAKTYVYDVSSSFNLRADKCCFFRGINNTPLHHFQMEDTQNQYCTVIIKQLAMLMRPKKKYDIPLTADLQEALQLFEEFLQGGERDLAKDQLHNVFMALWKEKWKPTKDNAIPCPTIRALALMTLHSDGHFAEPKYVTSLISKWERAIRLAFVKEIKALSETMEEEEACRILQPWFTEKSLCPFNSLRSLQHRASSITKTTMALPKIVWVDRINWTTLLYEGTRISLPQIIAIMQEMEKDLIEAWENNVLLGLKVRVNYDKIFEDLSNTNVGYSFLTDPRNDMFKDQDHLLVAIMEDPVLQKRFLRFDEATGQLVWNKSALRVWLFEYSHFQKLALTRCELLAGGPGRSTEFTAMQQCNTENRSTRSINILDKYVTLVRLYHKTSELVGHDTFLPHALDGVLSDLLIQDLAIAKPFAQFAAHLCFPQQPDIQQLYHDYLFVNNTQLFVVQSISEVLKNYTTPVLGISLGISDWRHIAIAFKRKLCSEAIRLYNGEFSEDSVFARHAGHGKGLEDRIYGLSPDALLGASEDLIFLFMAASTKWQVIHEAVPGKFSPSIHLSWCTSHCNFYKVVLHCHTQRPDPSTLINLSSKNV